MSTTLDAPALLSARADRFTPRAVRKFRPDIEGLRAIAVTLVVLSHLGLGFPGGYIGVDVFFVISGFLITRQLTRELDRRKRISLRGFYARRVRRILPAATVVIVGTVLACWEFDSPLRVRSDALDGLFAGLSGINWRLASIGTNYFQAGAAPSPFQHFWSLAVEEQFYLVWPALLLVVGFLAGHRFGRRASVVWVLLLIMAASLFLSISTTGSSPSWAYFGAQTRAWELASGALLAMTVDVWTRMPPALASQMSWLGLGLIALAALVYSSSTAYPGSAVMLPVAGAAFVIAGGCPGWSRGAELVLKRRPMQFLGKTSYSWYLTHWPVLTILPLALGYQLTLPVKGLVLVSSLALAIAMFGIVEHPVRISPWLGRKPRRSLALGGLLVLGSIGTATIVSDHVTIAGGGGMQLRTAAARNLSTVQKAVLAGTRLQKLPSNVTPPLLKVSGDRPFTTRTCLASDPVATVAPGNLCTIGDPHGTRTMAVVGDSHANEWTPAINAFAKADHWKIVLFMKSGCPPGVYPDDIDPLTNRIYTQCNQWRNGVFARLRALRPNVVFVASELRTLDIDPGGMVQAIHDYQSAGARVIYMEDTPNPENVGSVPDCLAQNVSNIQACSLARAAPSSRLSGFIQRQVEATAVKDAGVALIDPTPWFCTATTCPPVINNTIVYIDNSHTTAAYVKWLTPVMSAALRKATS